MAIRKAEVLFIGDAASIVRAAQTAETATVSLTTKIKGSATEIIAAQDRIAAAGNRAAAAAIKAGDTSARAATLAGRAALDQAKAVGASTTEQVAAYRRASAEAVRASEQQSAAAAKAAEAQRVATAKSRANMTAGVASMASSAKSGATAVVALGTAAVYSAAKFQAAMEQIRTQAGASQGEVNKMSKAVLGLALSTEQGPVKLAKALYELESVGLRGAKAMQSLRASSELAAVGGADLQVATSAVASAMVAWHLKADQAGKTSATLNAIVGAGKMHMQDLVEAMGTKLPGVADMLGISLHSVGGALAVFTDAGESAQVAATNLVTPLFKMAVVTAPKAREALASIGLGVHALANDFRTGGINKAIDDLHAHLIAKFGNSQAGKNAQTEVVATAFGGSKGSAPIMQMLTQVDRLGQRFSLVGQGIGQWAKRVADEHATAAHKIKVAWSEIQVAFTGAGAVLLPIVGSVLGFIEKFVQQVHNGTGAGGKFADAIKTMATGIKAAAAWVVAAFNGVKAAVVDWYNKARPEIDQFLTAVKNLATGVYAVVSTVLAPVFEFILGVVKRVFPAIVQAVSGALQMIHGIIQIFAGIFTGDFGKAWQGVKNIFSGAVQAILGIMRGITAPMRQAAVTIVGAIANGIKSGFSFVVSTIKALVSDILSAVASLPGQFLNIGKQVVTGLINGITGAAGSALSTVSNLASNLAGSAMSALGINSPSKVFHDIGLGIIEGLVNGLLSAGDLLHAGLNQALIFPIDASIAALTTKKQQLQDTWNAIDQAAQKSQLVQAVATARLGGAGAGSGLSGALGGTGGSGQAASTAAIPTGVATMLATAQALVGTQYTWGGGHNGWDPVAALKQIGVDCSGFVSQVLHAGGVSLPGPLTTSGLAGALKPGAGRQGVTVWDKTSGAANQQHVIIQIAGKWFESGGVSGGVGQMTAAQAQSMIAGGFAPYHPASISGGMAAAGALIKGKITGPAIPNHNAEIAQLEAQLVAIRRQRTNLPIAAPGKAGNATRLADEQKRRDLANETLNIEKKIKALKATDTAAKVAAKGQTALGQALQALRDFNVQAKRAQTLAKIDLQIKNLQQLKAFKDAIASLRVQVHDLASQAAQVWNTAQHAAINNGPQAAQLAAMQAQDQVDQAERQLDTLNKALAAAQKTGDAAAIQDAQQQLTDFMRQQDEQRLQNTIDAQNASIDAQTAGYQAGLDAQLTALTNNLAARKTSYATWAQQVNAILVGYGLSVATDPTTEGTVDAGPGPISTPVNQPLPTKSKTTAVHKATTKHTTTHHRVGWGGHRASGGPVQPGYVYRVGEHGPEDVAFGQHGTVMTASQTARNGDGMHIHGDLIVNSRQDAERMARRLAFKLRYG